MPLMQDTISVALLRRQHPVLTHTSSCRLDVIRPSKNVDTYQQNEREIVCATSDPLQRDFYALRCNERQDMINHAISFSQNGMKNKLFIFEKMNERYYEHEVSSEPFVPVVAAGSNSFVSGEWIAETAVEPLGVREGTKSDVLARTKAGVYTVVDRNRYLAERRQPENWQKLKNPDLALGVIENMVGEGILKCEKMPQKQHINLLSLKEKTR